MGCVPSKQIEGDIAYEEAGGKNVRTSGSVKPEPVCDPLSVSTAASSHAPMNGKSDITEQKCQSHPQKPQDFARKEPNNGNEEMSCHSDGNGSVTSFGSSSGHRSTNENRRGSGYESEEKRMKNSNSVIGLDSMIEARREEGDLKTNVVHIEVPFGKPIEEVYSGVHTGQVLGSGISGMVRLGTHKATGVNYAVKCLDLGLIETEEGLQQLREEIFIMCQLDHPNIVRLEEVYESHNEIYLVQELCLGGELFDRLDEQPDYHYTEQQCARLVKQMLSAVRYIHKQGIVHRDLKLENFLFSTTSPDSELKMIDFGLSKHFSHGEVHQEAVGTPYTVAPEVIKGRYDERCDVWAIGVITFLLLSGDPPFGGCGGPEPLMTVRSNILKGAFAFEPEDIWCNVSGQARTFISSLLVTDPLARPSAAAAQKSPWLLEWTNNEKKTQKDGGQLNSNVVKALVNFKEYSDMRKLLCEVLSFTLLPEQIKGLRAEFEKMDTDGSGEISLSALKTALMQKAGAGSLGALTEEEVEDIFNAMRVRKTETTIQWHEFIAAGLSQCQVDDRNLRIAFDRLDGDHKGYISFDDVLDLMGSDGTEETIRAMYQDSLNLCRCQHARITYGDFLRLMKGQTPDGPTKSVLQSPVVSRRAKFGKVPDDGFSLDAGTARLEASVGAGAGADAGAGAGASASASASAIPLMPALGGGMEPSVFSEGSLRVVREVNSGEEEEVDKADICAAVGGVGTSAIGSVFRDSVEEGKVPSFAPLVPLFAGIMDDDGPLSFDGDDKLPDASSNVRLALRRMSAERERVASSRQGQPPEPLTPPPAQTSLGRAYTSPNPYIHLSPILSPIRSPIRPLVPPPSIGRTRSKSYDEQSSHEGEAPVTPHASRRCVVLPEHEHNNSTVEVMIKDESIPPLVVNRELYRAHRMMRLAVVEASKRFEEKQMMRARMKMLEQAEDKSNSSLGLAAGLVMRHGHKKQLSSEQSVRKMLHESEKETQEQLEQVSKRSGRPGRSRRKKTMSDMSGMLSSPNVEKTGGRQGLFNSSDGNQPGGIILEPTITEHHEEDKGASNGLTSSMKSSIRSRYSDGNLERRAEEEVESSPSQERSQGATQ